MILFDRVPAENLRLTDDGYLVGEAKVARTGIQEYLASEMGLKDGDPNRRIRVYRPEDEVFQQDAMKSYAYRPVTVDHPPEMVNADNWRQYSRGQTGAEVARDGETIRVPMVLMDKTAIQDWQDGKRELSMGYTSEIEFSDGETPNGEKYDAIQRNMKMNHLALVARARGGSELRLGDDDKGASKMTDTKLRTVNVDGFSVETTDAGVQAIEKLQKQLSDEQSKLSDAEEAHAEAVAAKDKEIAAKDAEIDDLKKKVMSDEDIDNEVRARADLIGKAKTVNDADYSGKSANDIRKACVVAKLGDKAIEGKSDAYIEARFDSLVEAADSDDPVRKVIRQGDGKTTDAYDEYITHLNTAYQGKKEAH